MAARATQLVGVRRRQGAGRWAREQLFGGLRNTALTVLSAALAALTVWLVVRFVFIEADWSVITANRRLIMLGRLPQEHEWRIWPPIWFGAALAGPSLRLWAPVGRRGATLALVALALLFALLIEGENALRFGGAVILLTAAYFAAGPLARERRGVLVRLSAAGWAVLPLGTLAFLVLLNGARTSLLGGLLLNVLLASVAVEAALPLGIALALARASDLPLIKASAIAYIEVIRGAPLVAWLFIAWFVLPDFLPPVLGINRLDLVSRAMLMFALFTAAYIAEIVRGGLQSVSRGQLEAAEALGLGGLDTTTRIVLPQALAAVIPALVGQLISLWKDTTLVSILALTDALGAAQAAVSQREFFGRQREVLVFAGALFWLVAFTMSRLSQRLERSLRIGQSQ